MVRSNGDKNHLFNQRGFSMIDLLASAAIIIIIFSFVLANFRTARYSGDINIVLKQIINGITTVRNMSLGGQMIDGAFPEIGYGIDFDLASPNQFSLFAAYEEDKGGNQPLPNGTTIFQNVEFTNFYGLTSQELDDEGKLIKPGEGSWRDIGNNLQIIFSLGGDITTNVNGYDYVGGKIRHNKTGQQAYFYVSLISGLVTGELYERK